MAVRREGVGEGGRGPEAEAGAFGVVGDLEQLALAVGAVDQVATVVGDQRGQLDLGMREAGGDRGQEPSTPSPVAAEIIGTPGTGGPGGPG